MGHAAVRLAFISTGLSGGSANQDLPPPTSGRWPTVSLSLVINLTVSERASDEVRKDGTPGSPMGGPFQTSGKLVGMFPTPSHTSESVPDYFPELGRVEPLVGRWVGPLEPRVWFC